ncbi:MAG: thioredoxin family protein [Elusimicrobiota bacterium]
MGHIIDMTTDDVYSFIGSGKAVVDIFAKDFCVPCKMMEPLINKISEKHDDVKFIKVNIEDHYKVTEDLSVSSVPTLIFFKNGEEVDRMIGLSSEEDIEVKINSL